MTAAKLPRWRVDGITDTDGLFITPIAMDQSNPDVLWTGGGGRGGLLMAR